jgi:DNA repair photolyase
VATVPVAVEGFRWKLSQAPRPQGELFEEKPEVHVGRGEFLGMDFLHVRSRTLINEVKGGVPLPFRHTINVYRGCSHACTYCFARPTHEYLGLGAGEDFERKIVVKVNALDVLARELDPRRWPGHPIAMGTNTDPYQRCEGKYRLTQGVIRLLSEARNPFSVLTKSTLVLRDVGLLAEAATRTQVRVDLSIGTLDEDVWRLTEPGAPNPKRRMRAVEALNEAGVPCGVLMGPVLPGLSDSEEQIQAVVDAAIDAGAVSLGAVVLHLRPGVKEHVMGWLPTARPELVERYEHLYRRGAYAKDEQARVSEIVRQAVARRGGPRTLPSTTRGMPAVPEPASETTPEPDPSEQLGLSL